jgi:hypothetical protein
MAGHDLEAFAAKCIWQGAYIFRKAHDTPLNEFQIGWATPDQAVTLLKKAQFPPQDVGDLEAKFTDVNWRAMAGCIIPK